MERGREGQRFLFSLSFFLLLSLATGGKKTPKPSTLILGFPAATYECANSNHAAPDVRFHDQFNSTTRCTSRKCSAPSTDVARSPWSEAKFASPSFYCQISALWYCFTTFTFRSGIKFLQLEVRYFPMSALSSLQISKYRGGFYYEDLIATDTNRRWVWKLMMMMMLWYIQVPFAFFSITLNRKT